MVEGRRRECGTPYDIGLHNAGKIVDDSIIMIFCGSCETVYVMSIQSIICWFSVRLWLVTCVAGDDTFVWLRTWQN